jgi:hypothetical protein
VDGNRSSGGQSRQAAQAQLFTTIADYRYLAPRIMALREERERAVADISLSRLLLAPEPNSGPFPHAQKLQCRLGGLFVQIGTWLQSLHVGTSPGAGESGAGLPTG